MLAVTFRVRLLTPTFLTGAYPARAELRWSSIDGSLRYWFRAMMGGFVGNNREALGYLESAVWGGSGRACPFRPVIIAPPQLRTVEMGTDFRLGAGYQYLAFSQYEHLRDEQRRDHNKDKRLQRAYIHENTEFTAELRFERPDFLLYKVIAGTFWLLSHFGGIGARSRRGFGAVHIQPQGVTQTALQFSAINGNQPLKHYTQGIAAIKETFQRFGERTLQHSEHSLQPWQYWNGTLEYATFADYEGAAIGAPSQQDATRWLSHWGGVLRGFRNGAYSTDIKKRPENLHLSMRRTTDDYQNVAAPYFDSDQAAVCTWGRHALRNDALGLPHMIQSRHRPHRPQVKVQWRSDSKSDWSDHRASPLWMRPVLLHNGQLGTIVTIFHHRFLPENAQMELRGEKGANKGGVDIKVPESGDVYDLGQQLLDYLGESYNQRDDRLCFLTGVESSQ